MNNPRIYIASKTKYAGYWRSLRSIHHVNIISTWIDEAGAGETKCFIDLWERCISESMLCDYLLLYKKTKEEILKGALIEAGCAIGSGSIVLGVGVEEYSFTNHPQVKLFDTVKAALESIGYKTEIGY